MALDEIRPCPCGSGKDSWWELDGRGIPLDRVCADCKQRKLAKYRPEIVTRWYDERDVDERIEPEDVW
jgi:hypothetical protein